MVGGAHRQHLTHNTHKRGWSQLSESRGTSCLTREESCQANPGAVLICGVAGGLMCEVAGGSQFLCVGSNVP